MAYQTYIFRAETEPDLARELINRYRGTLEKTGISHVMSPDIPPNSPNLYFVGAKAEDGRCVGAMGMYVCSPNGGPLEDAFCSIDDAIGPRFRAAAKDGLAKLCLGFVEPEHRSAGLYTHIIRVVIAVLPSLGVRHVTAVGSREGIRYYQHRGLRKDTSIGEVAYPPGGFVSYVGWADIAFLPDASAQERQAVHEMRGVLCSEPHSKKPAPRRRTSVLRTRARELRFKVA